MKTFRVTLDGKNYDVQVEELAAGTEPQPQPVASAAVAEPVAAAAPAPAPVPVAPVALDGTVISSPMPGTVLDVRVAVGDMVEQNQVLLILEAMKMENEIVAPVAGKISALHVGKGAAVESNTPMVSIG